MANGDVTQGEGEGEVKATAPRLEDQDARDAVAGDLDVTLVVEAAAGTGKTTALVERILSLLRTGKATLESLVAVTFTEKAAGEMKLRLRTEIERARRTATGAELLRLDGALSELEAAHIGTIHGFCADLLRGRPVEAKVDPLFDVAAEDESERLYDEAFTRWFQKTLAEPPEGVARVLRRASRDRGQDGPRESLWRAGLSLVGQRDFPAPWTRPAFDRPAALDAVVEKLRALARLAPLGTKDDEDFGRYLVKSLEEIERVVFEIDRREAASRGPDHDGVEALLRDLLSARNARMWNWKGSGQWYNRSEGLSRQSVVEMRAETKEELEEFLKRADADLAAALFGELREVVTTYEDLKARAGKLDFLDLLSLTQQLLRDDASVRAELQARFTHLLVDEFQDTDPLQADILLLLAAKDPAESDPSRVRAVPGKLFLVGDPKQSIYRFRRADVSLYEDIKKRLLSEGARLVHLRTSFRSAPSLQKLVNAAFEPRMKPNAARSQADYVPLAPFRKDPEGRPTVVALPVPRPYSDYGKVASWIIEESLPDAVGAYIEWLVTKSGWTVTERGSDVSVPIEPRHVCLLFRRLQSGGEDVTRPYVRALEVRRIPHVLVGGRSFHDREEVIALRSAAAALEWPDDALSVYATLRGPYFALADDQLLAFRKAAGHLHPLRPRDDTKLTDLTRPVARALDVLAKLHASRNRRPIADTMSQLLEVTRAHAGVAIWPSGEQALGNILRMLDVARRFEQRSVTSFRAFVAHMDREADRGGANEAPVVEEGSDGVRMMTVHKAKGLEFPVVVLANPTAPLVAKKPSRFVDPATRLCAFPLCGAAPYELSSRAEAILEQDREEAIRLLYVATTRAREILVVPIVGDPPGDEKDGWTSPLDDVVTPRSRRTPQPAPGCPPFGDDTVLERPAKARPSGPAIKPGLHAPIAGEHEVVVWCPKSLPLGREDDAGLRQDRILRADASGKSTAAKDGVEAHARWKDARDVALASASVPSVVVRTPTDLKEAAGAAAAGEDTSPAPEVPIQETTAARGLRPSGKRFGVLVHAVLAAVPLDADAEAVADVARVQARIVGIGPEEEAAARDAALAALAHPLLARARAADRVVREAPMILREEDGALLEGVVDLAFHEAGAGWTVIDFKTDVDLAPRQAGYARQVDAYCRAIAAATGEPATGLLLRV
jgi:ATP-dependent exoDNAse (exonuclease V) beta subunit